MVSEIILSLEIVSYSLIISSSNSRFSVEIMCERELESTVSSGCSSCYCLMSSEIRVVILESSSIRDWRASETRFDAGLDDITDN